MNAVPSFLEDHVSQIPALQLLQKVGYEYLSPDEALAQRSGKTSNVFLEEILLQQLDKLNSFQFKGKAYQFSSGNLANAVQDLKDLPMQNGYISASQHLYDLLTLGKSLEQTIEGDKKSFTLQYIDWKHPERNVYHVTEEFSVLRTSKNEHYRPDLVLFVNGIPLVIIECKKPFKGSLEQAISQHLRNQQEDGIRNLYVYSQFLLAIDVNNANYATTGTKQEFWGFWRERFNSKEDEAAFHTKLHQLKNKPLTTAQNQKLFHDRFRYVANHFKELEKGERKVTAQDQALYSLCRPERLLDLIYNFIVYDDGVKKVCRYQQYFGIRNTINRIHTYSPEGKRNGGVVWHTQGSGKSLTMVMLAQMIASDKQIRNPKIVLVTDRIDLDDQISDTFKKCGKKPEQAKSGKELLQLLADPKAEVITTIINKFASAVKKAKEPFDSPDIFVLVDEGHRTQYGSFNVNMHRVFSKACFIGFTGTPLMKKEKNTAAKFGGIIDTYSILQAVEDGAVVPLLYEGRLVAQDVNSKPLDNYFTLISEPLTDYQKADLKRKFSRAEQLNEAEKKDIQHCLGY